MNESINGFTMFEHEEFLENGEYVCIKCGVVLGQEYIYIWREVLRMSLE